ncbi:MAG: GatB/YqeY domain-containing protein [Flavobacteriales bacterium]|nr:MAG: GatB/YqeY domain-containing protein [Flavobacteriales bacterium]
MSLENKITASLKEAMKNKDKDALNALRAIKSAILLAKTEKAGVTLDEKSELALLQKLQKQRKESAEIFREQNRPELAEEEEAQLRIIEEFLPKQLSAQELEAIIKEVIATTGASSMADMGKVMGAANQSIAGRAGGKEISDMVKSLLSKV